MQHVLSGLKSWRTSQGVRAVDLARRIGIAVESYRRIERGERRIYFDKAIALATYLGLDNPKDLGREPTVAEQVDLFKLRLEAEGSGQTVDELRELNRNVAGLAGLNYVDEQCDEHGRVID